jgi:small nuclear ribonucleoprotein (snRNP)-like protein
MAEYAVFIQGLSDALEDVSQLPERTKRAIALTIPRVTQRARTEASRRMRAQINWTASYLNDKLTMKIETGETYEGVISTTFRPTSLAQFASGSKQPWSLAKRLHVGEASFRTLQNPLLFVPLRRGTAPITEDNRNIGLAVRLKDGETIKGKYKVRPISKGLYLLFGPSSSQVFYTVAEDLIPDVSEWLDAEFARQLNRKDL